MEKVALNGIGRHELEALLQRYHRTLESLVRISYPSAECRSAQELLKSTDEKIRFDSPVHQLSTTNGKLDR